MDKELILTAKEPGENNSQYAYRVLYENLMRMTLRPGQKLNEVELTASLGISSTPFRQALSRLREEGLVDIRPQSGTTVSFIDYYLLQENIFIRASLEAAVLEQLCREGLSEHYQERLQENLNLQALYVSDPNRQARFFELDTEFHKLLFEAAGKSWTYTIMCRSCAQFDRVRYVNAFTEHSERHAGPPFYYMGHKDLLQTILQGDSTYMRERVLAHLFGGDKSRIEFPPHILPYIVNCPQDL